MEIPQTANCKVKLKDLIFDKDNPNTMTKQQMEALWQSMQAYGDLQHVVIDQENRILDGAHRAQTLINHGIEETDAIRISIESDADRRIIRQTMNKLRGTHNPELDAKEFVAILQASQEKKLFEVSAIRETDFYRTLALAGKDEKDEDFVPLPPATPITQPGDVWQLGAHRLICGDSTLPETYEKLMGGGKADLLLTDPPYGVSYGNKNKFLNAISRGNHIQTPIIGDQDKPEKMKELWVKAMRLAFENTSDGSAYYSTGPQGGELLLLLQAFIESGWGIKHMLIWIKNNIVLGRSDYNYQHEPILYGWKGTHKFYGRSGESSVWRMDKSHASKMHPTQKPVELAERAMLNSSREGEIVLDCFAGSGFSLIAAHKLKRIWRGIELEPSYCDVVAQRFEHYAGIKAERIPANPHTSPIIEQR